MVFRAVAVTDGTIRTALPAEYGSRDAGGIDNLSAFLDHAGRLARSNADAPVQATVLGEGDRAVVPVTADAWRDDDWSVDLDLLESRVLADVRLAGDAPGAAFWLGGATANDNTTPIGALAVRFTSTGDSYAFWPHGGVTDLEYLVVAGGGGGGLLPASGNAGAGGGAGGLCTNVGDPSVVCDPFPCSVSVGAGGAPGENGEPSSLAGVNTVGGGAGGVTGGPGTSGSVGGSGGGGGAEGGGTAGEGNAGAAGATVTFGPNTRLKGGGGGGSQAGGAAPGGGNSPAGAGGPGLESAITGVAVRFAGGGGGGNDLGAGGTGGDGGGGAGRSGGGDGTAAVAGIDGTGGGGGGGGRTDTVVGASAAGGSCVVIVRYALP